MKEGILFSAFFLFFSLVFAQKKQEYAHYQLFTVEDGLSQATVTCLSEDAEGFLWVGTENGLNRYDGYHFLHFFQSKKNPKSLSSSWIRVLFLDSKKRLWIGTNGGGLNRLEKDLTFTRFDNLEKVPKEFSEGQILEILEDSKNNLWLSTETGLYYFDTQNETATLIKKIRRVLFLEFSKDTLIAHNEEGNFGFNKHSFKHLYFREGEKIKQSIKDNLGNVFSIRNRKVVVKTAKGKEIVLDKGQDYAKFNGKIRIFYKDREGNIWAKAEKGLYFVNPQNLAFRHFEHYGNEKYGFWTANNTLENFVRDSMDIEPQIKKRIYTDSKNDIWIVSRNALRQYRQNKIVQQIDYFTDKGDLENDQIWSFLGDQDKIWLGTNKGIQIFDVHTQKTEYIPAEPQKPFALNHHRIRAMLKDRNADFWIGTGGGGLNFLDRKTQKFYHFSHDPNKEKSLPDNKIWALYEDSEGNIWVGTSGGGVAKLDKKTQEFEIFDVENGLSSNIICGILEDSEGNIWLSTYQGINKIDLKTKKIEVFGKEEGLAEVEFNANSFGKDVEGNLYFMHKQGVLVFDPAQIRRNTAPPQTAISSLKINEKNIHNFSEKIVLNQDDHFELEFTALSFQAPMKNQYTYQIEGLHKNWIKTLAQNRKIALTGMASGSYKLRLRTSNNHGVWNEKDLVLEFEVLPPWYWAWYMKILYVALIGFAIWTRFRLLKIQKQNLERIVFERTQELQTSNQFKDQLFAIIAHDLRSPVISFRGVSKQINYFLAKGKPEHILILAKSIDSSAKKLHDLLDNLLHWALLQNHGIVPKPVCFSLNELIQKVSGIFEESAKSQNINLEIEMEKDLEMWADTDMIELILRNLVQNAIKFTPENGKITIISYKKNTDIYIRVEDTGMGIEAEKLPNLFDFDPQKRSISQKGEKGTGLGLVLCKQFVELNKGEISVRSEKNKGTAFEMRFFAN